MKRQAQEVAKRQKIPQTGHTGWNANHRGFSAHQQTVYRLALLAIMTRYHEHKVAQIFSKVAKN